MLPSISQSSLLSSISQSSALPVAQPSVAQPSVASTSLSQSAGAATRSNDALSNMLTFVRAQLQAAPGGTLKAVELANSVRDTFGNGLLSLIRERHLGLLNLLESFPQLFKVGEAE